MISRRKPSYKAGYARSKSESANPGLWEGLKIAFVPALGATGSTVKDLAGTSDGALVNVTPDTAWGVSKGKEIIDLAGGTSNEGISHDQVNLGTEHTIVVNCRRRATGDTVWGGDRYDNYAPYFESNSSVYYKADAVFVTLPMSGGRTTNTTDFYTYMFRRKGIAVEFWLDGIFQSTADLSSSGDMLLDAIGNAYTSWHFDGQLSSAMAYDRALSPAEINQLYVDPLAPFQLRQNVAYFLPVTGGVNLTTNEGIVSGDSHSFNIAATLTTTEGSKSGDNYNISSGDQITLATTEGGISGDANTVTIRRTSSLTDGTIAGDAIGIGVEKVANCTTIDAWGIPVSNCGLNTRNDGVTHNDHEGVENWQNRDYAGNLSQAPYVNEFVGFVKLDGTAYVTLDGPKLNGDPEKITFEVDMTTVANGNFQQIIDLDGTGRLSFAIDGTSNLVVYDGTWKILGPTPGDNVLRPLKFEIDNEALIAKGFVDGIQVGSDVAIVKVDISALTNAILFSSATSPGSPTLSVLGDARNVRLFYDSQEMLRLPCAGSAIDYATGSVLSETNTVYPRSSAPVDRVMLDASVMPTYIQGLPDGPEKVKQSFTPRPITK